MNFISFYMVIKIKMSVQQIAIFLIFAQKYTNVVHISPVLSLSCHLFLFDNIIVYRISQYVSSLSLVSFSITCHCMHHLSLVSLCINFLSCAILCFKILTCFMVCINFLSCVIVCINILPYIAESLLSCHCLQYLSGSQHCKLQLSHLYHF